MSIICPVCKEALDKREDAYRCKKKHSFDIAKEGYINLLLRSSKESGDNKEMVLARKSFLESGFYQPLLDRLIELIQSYSASIILDAGCGEGYYTNHIQERIKKKIIAIDMSKNALKYASKKNQDVRYILSSIFDLPIQANSVDIILNIFAPCAPKEFNRILVDGGIMMKIDPNENHLKEMKDILYEQPYENKFKPVEDMNFIAKEVIEFKMELKQKDIEALFHMTPYWYKTPKKQAEKLLSLEQLSLTASFIISMYHNK